MFLLFYCRLGGAPVSCIIYINSNSNKLYLLPTYIIVRSVVAPSVEGLTFKQDQFKVLGSIPDICLSSVVAIPLENREGKRREETRG